jgi:hypothetical protein
VSALEDERVGDPVGVDALEKICRGDGRAN